MYKRIILTILIFAFLFSNINLIYGQSNDIAEGSAVVIDSDSLSVLYNKNMNKKIYPASTTKILTAILAIENLNLDANITVSKEEMAQVPIGSSTMHLKAGETLTVRDLLYGLLLPSGNDAAIVLAEAVSGSTEKFVMLMNSKLKEIGCSNTHFDTPHGFSNNSHYSTAYDMALLMKYASQNQTFRTITETKEYTINPTNGDFTSQKLENTDTLLSKDLGYELGGKTGYTDEAGNVFICFSNKDGKNLIACVYDGLKNENDKEERFSDIKMLIDNTYQNYDKTKIIPDNTIKISYIDKKTHKNYTLGIDQDIYSLTNNTPYSISYDLSSISINKDIVNGTVTISSGNSDWQFKKTYDLKILNTQDYIDNTIIFSDILNIALLISILLLTLIIFSIILSINKKKSKIKSKKDLRYKNVKVVRRKKY